MEYSIYKGGGGFMLTNLKNKMETDYGYVNVRIGNNSGSDYMIYYAKDKGVRSKDMALQVR